MENILIQKVMTHFVAIGLPQAFHDNFNRVKCTGIIKPRVQLLERLKYLYCTVDIFVDRQKSDFLLEFCQFESVYAQLISIRPLNCASLCRVVPVLRIQEAKRPAQICPQVKH